MIDAVGTNKYAYAVGGQLWTEDGPFADDTVTNSYNNRLRVGMDLQQPTGVWPNTEVLPKIRTSGLNRKHTGNEPIETKQTDSPEVLRGV